MIGRPRQPEIAELRRPSRASQTLPGLRSRCTTPCWWACSSAAQTSAAMRTAVSTGSGDRTPRAADPRRPHPPCIGDDVGAALVLADVVHRHDVRMVAEPRHGTGLAPHVGGRRLARVGRLRILEDRDRHVAIELAVVREIDPLAAAVAEQPHDPVPAAANDGPAALWPPRRPARSHPRSARRSCHRTAPPSAAGGHSPARITGTACHTPFVNRSRPLSGHEGCGGQSSAIRRQPSAVSRSPSLLLAPHPPLA